MCKIYYIFLGGLKVNSISVSKFPQNNLVRTMEGVKKYFCKVLKFSSFLLYNISVVLYVDSKRPKNFE